MWCYTAVQGQHTRRWAVGGTPLASLRLPAVQLAVFWGGPAQSQASCEVVITHKMPQCTAGKRWPLQTKHLQSQPEACNQQRLSISCVLLAYMCSFPRHNKQPEMQARWHTKHLRGSLHYKKIKSNTVMCILLPCLTLNSRSERVLHYLADTLRFSVCSCMSSKPVSQGAVPKQC